MMSDDVEFVQRNYKKWTETCWRLFFLAFLSIYEYGNVWNKSWMWNVRSISISINSNSERIKFSRVKFATKSYCFIHFHELSVYSTQIEVNFSNSRFKRFTHVDNDNVC